MDNEARLVRALVRRDPALWAAMYDRHVGAVFGLADHLVGRDRAIAADEWKPGTPVPKPGVPEPDVGQTVGPNPLMGTVDDPVLPFWCQGVMPEQVGHLNEAIGQPDNDREFVVELDAKDGPPGTILFRGRDTNSPPSWKR